jgi:hypothetical protein
VIGVALAQALSLSLPSMVIEPLTGAAAAIGSDTD